MRFGRLFTFHLLPAKGCILIFRHNILSLTNYAVPMYEGRWLKIKAAIFDGMPSKIAALKFFSPHLGPTPYTPGRPEYTPGFPGLGVGERIVSALKPYQGQYMGKFLYGCQPIPQKVGEKGHKPCVLILTTFCSGPILGPEQNMIFLRGRVSAARAIPDRW